MFEIVDDFIGNTYRAVYAARFGQASSVLHAFQKKSPTGIKTAERDVDLVAKRLKLAQQHYQDRYGKSSS